MEKIELHQETTLKTVFDDFYSPLVLFATRYIKNRANCQDLVQQLFVTLYSERYIFKSRAEMRSYLFTTIKNKCLNHLSHERVKNNFVREKVYTAEQTTTFEIEAEAANLLHKGIQQLSERQRQVIKLHLKGLSNEVIALRLDIGVQTVKNLKAKAYQKIRSFLKTVDL